MRNELLLGDKYRTISHSTSRDCLPGLCHCLQLDLFHYLFCNTLVVVYDGLPLGGDPRCNPNKELFFADATLPKGPLGLLHHRRRRPRTPNP